MTSYMMRLRHRQRLFLRGMGIICPREGGASRPLDDVYRDLAEISTRAALRAQGRRAPVRWGDEGLLLEPHGIYGATAGTGSTASARE
jgi:hypothetical protein